MPLYTFDFEDGSRGDEFFPSFASYEQATDGDGVTTFPDGRKGIRNMGAETKAVIGCGRKWPVKSTSFGVQPSQIREAEEHARKLGTPLHFTSDGDAIFESRGHRKRVLEAHGWFDKDGGYGDPQPKSGKCVEQEV